MLRYLGPKLKKLKRLNIHMQPEFSTKYFILNTNKYNNKMILSFYLLELFEKQKLKFTFSLSEKIIKKYILFMHKYNYKKFNLINIIEIRLDNTIFNLGYSITIAQAKQLIIHGYFFVNFKLIKIPSFLLKKGDIITLSPKSYYIFKLCKKNLYKKYIKNSNIYDTIYICKNTLISIIYSILNIYNNNNYNNILIMKYYSY
ncbi:ribosomal protein S4 (apicoplast) [Eimeria tenella]|uniref:Small ribosomal subunit protein uS4c n=1 Tax=Eimeria tenella TaxID=5802 RepID=RR4_EIMTE|nr:ribosomal protein S4 [Eimeria tenella]Q7YN81.1 RecName: Full=Small ribosomal subunit protein uS4c; AltName: Full=Apicoplast 30S ribosomal protein S4 [Eimeria tenella]AAO40222.1 ribosomal protein S4 [Eimeria tenella]|eukprot:NP_852621.1 ribosomal protein S4 (apicoplast) [Eimeria tenella strain Penn State]